VNKQGKVAWFKNYDISGGARPEGSGFRIEPGEGRHRLIFVARDLFWR